jgi:uncharacterized membrane protein
MALAGNFWPYLIGYLFHRPPSLVEYAIELFSIDKIINVSYNAPHGYF